MNLKVAKGSIVTAISTIWRENSGLDRFFFLFRGARWQIRKRLHQSFVTKLPNNARLKVYPHSTFSAVFYTRWVEKKDLLFIRKHADLAPTFVDVGANVGLFSASLFDKFSHFVLIEPMLACVAALRETCSLNPSVQCEIINTAVSDRTGVALFFNDGDFSTTSRIVASAEAHRSECKSITVATLDHLLREHKEDFVVKVDVEGHEEQVFRGAEGLFEAARIKLLVFERLGRTNIDNILTFFADMNYVTFFVQEDGTVTFDTTAVTAPLINLFACPRPVLSFLERTFQNRPQRS
jgi:FkbM family methyltransferase